MYTDNGMVAKMFFIVYSVPALLHYQIIKVFPIYYLLRHFSLSVSNCLSLFVSLCLYNSVSLSLSVCLSVCLSFSVCPSLSAFLYLSDRLLSVCLSICLSISLKQEKHDTFTEL